MKGNKNKIVLKKLYESTPSESVDEISDPLENKKDSFLDFSDFSYNQYKLKPQF